MDELEGHPEGWNSRGDGDAFGDVAATDYTPCRIPTASNLPRRRAGRYIQFAVSALREM
jgi:hypothetical protein